jgi:Plasmid pRiA4b ORF-3-like protein
MVPMPTQIDVFEAELVDFTNVRRTIAIRSSHTLHDLHHALRAAFAWDDEHLYSFWLKGGFWARNGSEYTHPFHAAQSNPLAPFATGPAPKSADVRLDRLKLDAAKARPSVDGRRASRRSGVLAVLPRRRIGQTRLNATPCPRRQAPRTRG